MLKKLESITSTVNSSSGVKQVLEHKRTTRSGKELNSSNGKKKSTKVVKVVEYKRKVQIKNSKYLIAVDDTLDKVISKFKFMQM